MDFIKKTPENITVLVKNANNKNNWPIRLKAVEELGKYDCQQTRDVITRIALHDKVFEVKETAFRIAQALGVTIKGKPIILARKDVGFKASDFKKTFSKVKRETKMDALQIEIFKRKLIQVNPEMYDVMQYEKGSNFDQWITNIYISLPKN